LIDKLKDSVSVKKEAGIAAQMELEKVNYPKQEKKFNAKE